MDDDLGFGCQIMHDLLINEIRNLQTALEVQIKKTDEMEATVDYLLSECNFNFLKDAESI